MDNLRFKVEYQGSKYNQLFQVVEQSRFYPEINMKPPDFSIDISEANRKARTEQNMFSVVWGCGDCVTKKRIYCTSRHRVREKSTTSQRKLSTSQEMTSAGKARSPPRQKKQLLIQKKTSLIQESRTVSDRVAPSLKRWSRKSRKTLY